MKKVFNRKKICVSLFMFWATCTLFAQVPGYMGKTRHLQGGIKFFPSFGHIVNLEQPDQNYVVGGVNYRLELGMEFMVSRKSSVGFNGHYFNTAERDYTGYINSPYKRFGIEGGAIGASYKVHFGPWVAPVGVYYRVEAGAMIYTVSDVLHYYGNSFGDQTFASPYINNAFGRTHVFANRITLDYGFEVGFVFPPYDKREPDHSVKPGNFRMLFHYLANFYVKIGGIF